MDEEKGPLEDYIKKGLEKGFNINYIKETLTKHGHNTEKVETASNNIMGMKYPDELKPHLDEVSVENIPSTTKSSTLLKVLLIILIIITATFTVNFLMNRTKIVKVQSQLDEIKELGVNIDDLSTEMKTQMNLIKEKDLTIQEKEQIIEDQIGTIEQINTKIELQRSKLKELLLDIMNRMIGRMGE
jgi:hypothetical protein